MSLQTNTFALPAGASVGDVITVANSAAGGQPFAVLPAITGGSYNYSATGGEIRLGSVSGYFRLDNPDPAARFVARRPLWLQANPTADSVIMQVRSASAAMANVVMRSDRTLRCGPGVTIISGSTSSVLALSTLYYVELAATKESAVGAGDGKVQMRITDASDVVVGTAYDSGNVTGTGNLDGSIARLGGFAAMTGWTLDKFDGPVRTQDLASGWIGPVGTNTPPVAGAGADSTVVQGNVVTLSGTASDSDGTITGTVWSIVAFPSGASAPTISSPSSLTGASFTPSVPGTYTVRLTVTDNLGATDTDDKNVVVTSSAAAKDELVYTTTGWR